MFGLPGLFGLPSDWNLSPRGRKIRDRVLVFVVLPLMLAMGAWVLISEINEREERRVLLSETRAIGASALASAELIPEHDPRVVQPCLSITDEGALQELAAFFPAADETDYGGHQVQQFKYKLRLRFADGREATYLIRFFEMFPHDVYLNRQRYSIYDDRSYSNSIGPQIRVPRLLPWLRERAMKARCPVE